MKVVVLSAIDVLESTGQHSTFLRLLAEHDEEGYDAFDRSNSFG